MTLTDYKFIDIHVHILPGEMLKPAVLAAIKATQPDEQRLHELSTDPHRLVAYMDEHNIEWLGLINYPSPDVIGFTHEINAFSARFAAHYPHRFIPFGGIDPRQTPDMAGYMDYLLGELGLKAIKLHPPHQFFNVNDYLLNEFEPLTVAYEKCIEYGAPAITGRHLSSKDRAIAADPMPIDDVPWIPDQTLPLTPGDPCTPIRPSSRCCHPMSIDIGTPPKPLAS
jgi:predicted TIM-barrel fold metal-dependent hydrolase